jgi:hypothetical protein
MAHRHTHERRRRRSEVTQGVVISGALSTHAAGQSSGADSSIVMVRRTPRHQQ